MHFGSTPVAFFTLVIVKPRELYSLCNITLAHVTRLTDLDYVTREDHYCLIIKQIVNRSKYVVQGSQVLSSALLLFVSWCAITAASELNDDRIGLNTQEVKQKLVTLASIITLLQIETRVQAPGSKPSEIALRYESGSDQVCSGRSSKTELLFSCGNSLGAPVFVDDRFVQLHLVNYVGFN